MFFIKNVFFTTCDESIHVNKYLSLLNTRENLGQITGCQDGKPLVEGELLTVTEEIYEPESIISSTEDDYGMSYYYRGAVTDNYVNFADMCWRVVRIQGVRQILPGIYHSNLHPDS